MDGKRITFKHSQPNPLFQHWLEELHEEAKAKKSKLEKMLEIALLSLSKYPLPLRSGAECAILQGFNKKLCIFLDKRLAVYNSQLNDNSDGESSEHNENIPQNGYTQIDPVNKLQSRSQSKPSASNPRGPTYKPAQRSGGYAILMALLESSKNHISCLKKDNLIEKAQKYSEESFVRPKPDSFYTAWSNMTRLISKGLVKKSGGKKAEYSLTEEGHVLAAELEADTANTPTLNNILFNEPSTSQNALLNPTVHHNDTPEIVHEGIDLELAPQSFNIILLIDKNETGGVTKKNDPTVAQFNKYPDLKHEYRSLKVGDFTWIAQHKINKELELVLPYVVERKRMDDLGASIKDGRFHEQKFRLKKCGLKNVIYMVENYGSNKHVGLPVLTLMQAIANTRVQDEFKVHITESLSNSARFLAMMTKRLTVEYENKQLKGSNAETKSSEELMTFGYFNKSSLKTKALTVTETFIKILLQLKGVSVEKALAITGVYKTPRSLIEAYNECSIEQGEMLLAKLKYGNIHRNVGPTVSKAIHHVFTKLQ